MLFLGIDISKATFDASLLINDKHKNKNFENTLKGFEELQAWVLKLSNQDEVLVCMEGTGKLWECLAEYLVSKQYYVSVVNPSRIKGQRESELKRSKTDELDAELIARFCREKRPAEWIAKSAEMKAVRDRQRYIHELKENKTQENNRLKAGRIDPSVAARIHDHIVFIDLQIAGIEKEIRQIVKENPPALRNVGLLRSIIGIGETTAITFISELPAIENFKNAKALETFCGLTPRRFESGTSVRGRARISKCGNARMRSALYMPALSALRANPMMKDFAKRMRDAGKPGKVIVVAIMRKLVRLMYAILKSGKPFDLGYVSENWQSALAA